MEEAYLCICGHQEFYIQGSLIITCGGCERIYSLVYEKGKIEDTKDFNKRIRTAGFIAW